MLISHFKVARFKVVYSMGVASMSNKYEWSNNDLGFNLLPSILKRVAGRPRKNMIKALDETKKKKFNKCSNKRLCMIYWTIFVKIQFHKAMMRKALKLPKQTLGLSNKRLPHHNS
jgi:hypothetical protein